MMRPLAGRSVDFGTQLPGIHPLYDLRPLYFLSSVQRSIIVTALFLIAVVSSILFSGTVSATIVLDFNDSILKTRIRVTPPANETGYGGLGAGAAYWTNYSEECNNVFGSTTVCGVTAPQFNPDYYAPDFNDPISAPEDMNPNAPALFSWGSVETDSGDPIYDTQNSLLRARYKGAGATLNSVTLESAETHLGPAPGPKVLIDPNNQFSYDQPTGTGSMVAYELPVGSPFILSPALISHDASQQRVSITIFDKDNQPKSVDNLDNLKVMGEAQGNYTIPAPPAVGAAGDQNQFVQFEFNTLFPINGLDGIELETDDIIQFRFFEEEGRWNNQSVGDSGSVAGFPDAYYGSMFLTIDATPNSGGPAEIAVDNVGFGDVRAGTGPVAGGIMTVTNAAESGADDLDGQFDAIDNAERFGGPYDVDVFTGLVAEDPSSIATREFSFDPGILADTATQGTEYTLTQSVSSTTASNSPQEGLVEGRTVGPLGQAEREGTPIANSADQEPVQVNLGTVGVDQELVEMWAMNNLFGEDLGQDLTSLTLFNAGFALDGNPGLFSIEDFADDSVIAAGGRSDEFTIRFKSEETGRFYAILQIFTDQEAELGFGESGRIFSYQLNVTVPSPATFALLAIGLLGLRLFHTSIHH